MGYEIQTGNLHPVCKAENMAADFRGGKVLDI
jgi:hypothetical protein